MTIEDIIEDAKEKRSNDSVFMALHREYKLNITEDKSNEEILAKMLIYFQEKGYLNVYDDDFLNPGSSRRNRGKTKSPYLD